MKKLNVRLSSGLAAAAGLAISAAASAQSLSMVSTQPGTFIDISATGTAILQTGDDTLHQFNSTIGNSIFPAGLVTVCTNGYMTAGANTGAQFTNVAIPAAGLPGAGWSTGTQGYLLPWWDDLDARNGTTAQDTVIYWQEVGGKLIVQWRNISHYINVVNETIDFQVQVFGTPVGGVFVQYLYNDTVFGGSHAANDNSASATIGYCNDANANGNNVMWSLNSPTAVASGSVLSIMPGSSGACCMPNGSCTENQSSNNCAAAGGVYAGNNVACAAANCPQPGACCLPTGGCEQLSTAECAARNGAYSGHGVQCGTVTCPQPGACCFADGSCGSMLGPPCLAAGGTYSGNGTSCGTVVCPQPTCYDATGLGVAIPDSGLAGTPGPAGDATLVISDNRVISNLFAKVRLSHTYQGDIRVQLVHPDNTAFDLVSRPGVPPPKFTNGTVSGFTTDNLGDSTTGASMVIMNGAASVYDNAAGYPGPPPGNTAGVNNPTGSWLPGSGGTFASVFGGKNVNGTWHLLVTDHWPIDVGTIDAFSVCLPPAQVVSCYANCDGSTTPPCLNVQDFNCFINRFNAGNTQANCDASTTAPVLNVQDFTCFLNRFNAGCSSC